MSEPALHPNDDSAGKPGPGATAGGPTATAPPSPRLAKCPTGIRGFDELTAGGLPAGRPTLVCGGPGCGKTLFAMEILVHGALKYGEPGVFMAFEESAEELAANFASLGVDLPELARRGLIAIDAVRVERSEIEVTGDYDLEGLFIRLGAAIDSVGARRVVLDTVESLFGAFDNQAILRAELRRLFRWLKERGVTAVITGERGDATYTRQGLEEYVSDCVILLDHRVDEQVSTRRLRVLKYWGSAHGTNEYPFLIGDRGLSVLPVTSLGLDHAVCDERVSTGVAALDGMLGGGLYRGSSVLISGTAGTCKTTLAAQIADAACRRGETCLYLASEESPAQIRRNMASVGIGLGVWVERGLLHIRAARPTLHGLESHLVTMHESVETLSPGLVVLDPIGNYAAVGSLNEAKAMLTRLTDYLKSLGITAVMVSLAPAGSEPEGTLVGISSIMDTWIILRDMEENGERNRVLSVLKSRGMAHSNQVREFTVGPGGLALLDPYLGPGGVLTGSSRLAQEAAERAEALARRQEIERLKLALERKRQALRAQVASLEADFAADSEELMRSIEERTRREERLERDRASMAASRCAADGPAQARCDPIRS